MRCYWTSGLCFEFRCLLTVVRCHLLSAILLAVTTAILSAIVLAIVLLQHMWSAVLACAVIINKHILVISLGDCVPDIGSWATQGKQEGQSERKLRVGFRWLNLLGRSVGLCVGSNNRIISTVGSRVGINLKRHGGKVRRIHSRDVATVAVNSRWCFRRYTSGWHHRSIINTTCKLVLIRSEQAKQFWSLNGTGSIVLLWWNAEKID